MVTFSRLAKTESKNTAARGRRPEQEEEEEGQSCRSWKNCCGKRKNSGRGRGTTGTEEEDQR